MMLLMLNTHVLFSPLAKTQVAPDRAATIRRTPITVHPLMMPI